MTTANVWVAVGSANPCKVEAVRSAFEDLYASAAPVQIHVTSHNAPSNVSDQPYGDAETKAGAVNRANAAWEAATISVPESINGLGKSTPDFSVGLEGGVEEAPTATAGIMAAARAGVGVSGGSINVAGESKAANVLWCMAWMAVRGSGSSICTLAKAPDSPYEADADASDKPVWGFGRTGSFELPPEVAALVHGGMELGDADDKVFNRVKSKHGSGTVGILTKGMIDRSSYYVYALKLALVPWIRPELYIDV